MKQLIFIYALSIFCLGESVAKPKIPPKDVLRIHILVELGHGRMCDGWGICDVDFSVHTDWYQRIGGIVGGLQITPDNQHFELSMSREDLQKYQPEKLAIVDGRAEVTFVEGFVFPNEVKEELKANRDLEIKPGKYPLTFIDGIFTIKFPHN